MGGTAYTIFLICFFLSLQKLTKGSNNWSVSEVTQALIILSHFHTLSGFIFGCGISSEIDDDLGHTYHQSYDDSYENGCHSDDDEQVSKKFRTTLAVSV